MHKLLKQQLTERLGLADDAAIAAFTRQIASAGDNPDLTPEVRGAPPHPLCQATTIQNEQTLPPLSQINSEQGLRRLRGNQRLYRDMLIRFANDYRHNTNRFTGDRDTSQRAAHTLKGVAATLGAEEVATLAAVVEKGYEEHAEQSEIARAILPLQQALLSLITELDTKLNQVNPAEEPHNSIDKAAIHKLILQLQPLLASADLELLSLVDTLDQQLCHTPYAQLMKKVKEESDNFNFNEALASLTPLIARLNSERENSR
ncbi:MAG: Hpt domain-containing protein [Gammaproteobacteria bacterium]|nr:Hpt domain-containing protein [Gammaproteobacteria bacterium]